MKLILLSLLVAAVAALPTKRDLNKREKLLVSALRDFQANYERNHHEHPEHKPHKRNEAVDVHITAEVKGRHRELDVDKGDGQAVKIGNEAREGTKWVMEKDGDKVYFKSAKTGGYMTIDWVFVTTEQVGTPGDAQTFKLQKNADGTTSIRSLSQNCLITDSAYWLYWDAMCVHDDMDHEGNKEWHIE